MTDLSQMSDADLQAAYAAANAGPALGAMSDADLTAAYRAAHPATSVDRAHALEGGILGGAAYGVTSPLDAVANAVQLGKAAIGTGVGAANTKTETLPDRTPGGLYHFVDRAGNETFSKDAPPEGSKPYSRTTTSIPDALQPGLTFPVGSALTGLLDKSDLTSTQAPRPDDAASRYLNTAGNVIGGVATGGGPMRTMTRAAAAAIPGAMAGRAVNELQPFDSDAGNNAASILVGALGTAANPLSRGAAPLKPENATLNRAVQNGQAEGYVFPPATTNPTARNRAVETIAGKVSTQQHASIENQPVTNSLGRRAMGLTDADGPISDTEIAQAKTNAAPGYDALRAAGTITPPPDFSTRLSTALANNTGASRLASSLGNSGLKKTVDELRANKTFDAGDAMDAIAALRDKASEAYRAGNSNVGAAYRGVSKVIEDAIDTDLTKRGGAAADMLDEYRASRQRFARIAEVEDARNPVTNNLVAAKLTAALAKGSPMNGELKTVAEAAGQAPKAFAEPNSSPVHHLGMYGPLIAAIGGEHFLPDHLGTAGLVAGAAIPAARWGARKYALGPGQAGALPKGPKPFVPGVPSGLYGAIAPTQN